jgi:hypothetical protein
MMKTSAWAHYNGEYGKGGVWAWYRTASRRMPQFAWFDTLEAFKAWYGRKLHGKHGVLIDSGHWAALDAADIMRHTKPIKDAAQLSCLLRQS